jgi:hypothetical protein
MPKLSCTFSLSTRVYEILKASAEVDNNSMSGYLEQLILGKSEPEKKKVSKPIERANSVSKGLKMQSDGDVARVMRNLHPDGDLPS